MSSKQCPPGEIVIDGVRYTKESAPKGDKVLLVLDKGFIFVGHVRDNSTTGRVEVSDCVNVRRWEAQGFGGLTRGAKTSKAILDDAEDFSCPASVEIFRVPLADDWLNS